MHWIYAHLIGDYLIQTDWMALNKKKSTWICVIHIITYIIPYLWTGLGLDKILLIGIEHFIQDRWNLVYWLMEKTGHNKFNKPPMAPWSIIVTDNILHILWVAWVASL